MADPDPTTDNLGKVLTTHELENRLMNLNDAEKQKLCEGELFLSSDSDITAKIFGIIFDIADSFSSNKNKVIELILPCLNESLPSSNARNIIRKYKTLLEKLNNLPDEERSQKLNQELVTRVKTQWKLLERYFDFEKLTQRVFVEKDQTSRFTIELFIKLGQFREKCSALTWEKICYFLANKYQTTKVPLANAVSTEFWNIQRELNKIRKYPDRKASLLMQEFVPPLPKPKNDDSKTTKPSDSISSSVKKENIQLESELEEAQTLEMYSLYEELAEMNVLVLKLTKDIEDTSSDLDTIDKERKKQVNLLRYELQKMTQRYNNLKVKLDDNTQKLAHYFPRNVGK